MELRSFVASLFAFVFVSSNVQAREAMAFEFTDPEDSVHLIVMNVNGQKVSGTVTKYIGGYESKEKYESKFEGKVLTAPSKAGQKIEVFLKSDKHNLDTDKNKRTTWILAPSGDLRVPVALPIGRQPYREVETFRRQQLQ